jgi:hypothetical protein
MGDALILPAWPQERPEGVVPNVSRNAAPKAGVLA